MLVWLTLPFNDFCGFRSVAVNSVYKLQFFYIYYYYNPARFPPCGSRTGSSFVLLAKKTAIRLTSCWFSRQLSRHQAPSATWTQVVILFYEIMLDSESVYVCVCVALYAVHVSVLIA